MSKIEQGYPAHPLSSWGAERLSNSHWDSESHGMSKRELVFLEFMSKLISTPDQFECSLNNKASRAKVYTQLYFKTLEEWDND